VEIPKEAAAEGLRGAGEHQDEVEEERPPAQDEHPEQDGECDGALHAGALPAALVEGNDAPRVQVGQDEHVHVQHRREHQGDAEEGDQAHDHRVVGVVHDEQRAGGEAGQPHQRDDGHGALRGHDAVVAQRVEDGDVAVRRDGAQEGQRGHHRAAGHDVDDVVQVAQHARVHGQQSLLRQQDEHRLHHVADAHQHVGHGQAADEVVHGRVQVAVLEDGQHHQDVLHQADEPQDEEEFLGDAELHAAHGVGLRVRGVAGGVAILHEHDSDHVVVH